MSLFSLPRLMPRFQWPVQPKPEGRDFCFRKDEVFGVFFLTVDSPGENRD